MTVTVTGLPEPLPNPADPSTFSDRASATLSAINPMMAQMNAQNIENNAINAAVNLSANVAELSATAAMSAANYKGPWLTLSSSLVGYPAFPAFSSVFHNGVFWFSNAAMANVSLYEPSSTSTYWTSIQQQNLGARNILINGKMEVAQNGTSFPNAGGYTLDGFQYLSSPDFAATVGVSTAIPANKGFTRSMVVTCTTAAAISSSTYAFIRTNVEGNNAARLAGVTFTLSFWAYSSLPGTYCVSFRNSSDRSYVAEYTINSSATWEKKSITVAGGLTSAGTWTFGEGTTGLFIDFSLTKGTSFEATPNAWVTGGVVTSNQVNLMGSVSNNFAIVGIQLEAGSYATDFEHRSYAEELRICQRYYEKVQTYFVGYSVANENMQWTISLKSPKCKSPTISHVAFANINCTTNNAVILGSDYSSFTHGCIKNAVTGSYQSGTTITFDARLS